MVGIRKTFKIMSMTRVRDRLTMSKIETVEHCVTAQVYLAMN